MPKNIMVRYKDLLKISKATWQEDGQVERDAKSGYINHIVNQIDVVINSGKRTQTVRTTDLSVAE